MLPFCGFHFSDRPLDPRVEPPKRMHRRPHRTPVAIPAATEAASSSGACNSAAHEPSMNLDTHICPAICADAPSTLTPTGLSRRERAPTIIASMAHALPGQRVQHARRAGKQQSTQNRLQNGQHPRAARAEAQER